MQKSMDAVTVQISNLEEKQKNLELSTVTTDSDVIGLQITEQSVSMYGNSTIVICPFYIDYWQLNHWIGHQADWCSWQWLL